MVIFEGDSSFCLAVVSLMIIGSFDCGWDLPTFIRVLLLALKYMDVSFHLPFCFGYVLRAVSIVSASLANISGDFSSCCSFSPLPVEIPVPVSTCFAYCVFLLLFLCGCFGCDTLQLEFFSPLGSTLQYFFPGCLCRCSSHCFGLGNLALPSFSFCPACACLSCVSSPLVFSPSSVCSPLMNPSGMVRVLFLCFNQKRNCSDGRKNSQSLK